MFPNTYFHTSYFPGEYFSPLVQEGGRVQYYPEEPTETRRKPDDKPIEKIDKPVIKKAEKPVKLPDFTRNTESQIIAKIKKKQDDYIKKIQEQQRIELQKERLNKKAKIDSARAKELKELRAEQEIKVLKEKLDTLLGTKTTTLQQEMDLKERLDGIQKDIEANKKILEKQMYDPLLLIAMGVALS